MLQSKTKKNWYCFRSFSARTLRRYLRSNLQQRVTSQTPLCPFASRFPLQDPPIIKKHRQNARFIFRLEKHRLAGDTAGWIQPVAGFTGGGVSESRTGAGMCTRSRIGSVCAWQEDEPRQHESSCSPVPRWLPGYRTPNLQNYTCGRHRAWP